MTFIDQFYAVLQVLTFWRRKYKSLSQ